VVLTVLDSATNQTTTDSVLVQVNTVTPNLTYTMHQGVGATPFQTTTFNGFSYVRRCGPANSTLLCNVRKTGTGTTNSTRYSINWGDGQIQDSIGSPLQPLTGANWAATGVQHTYSAQGLYTITITASNINGCSDTEIINFFWGSTPGGSISSPGGTAICLPDTLPFPLANIASNVPGTVYTITVSDSLLPSITYFHPVVPDTFFHYFQFPSCGFSNGQDTNCLVYN
jgi:hypothetical protein